MTRPALEEKTENQTPEAVDWRIKLSERVRAATRSAGVGVWEWNLIHRSFTFDERTYELFGLAPADEKLNLSVIFRCVHPQDRMRLAEELQRASTGVAELDVRFRVVTPSGVPRHLHAQAELIDEGRGLSSRLVGAVRDISPSQKLSDALAEERERLQVTLSSIGDAVIAADVKMLVTFLNPPASAMTGWSLEDAVGRPLGEVLNVGPGLTDDALLQSAQACLENENLARVRHSAQLIGRLGGRLAVDNTVSAIRAPLGDNIGVVLVLHDTSEAQELQRRLRHAATHDPLTDLANRTVFEENLAQAAAEGVHDQHALCFIDVDRFKVINDSAGHNAGDMFLKSIVGVLRSFVREQDTLARLGGDEFGLILRDISPAEAERIAGDMVRAAKDYRFAFDGRIYSAGVSIGVTRIVHGAPCAELIGQADAACYAAKNAGRGRAMVFQSSDEATHRRQEVVVAADMRQVIDENRLVLFGQEIVPVNPHGREKRHFEVLVRMFDRQYALIGPGAFIPAAERFAIMDEVDDWILREAIQNFGRRIAQLGTVEISLNLSANSLDNPTLLQFVMDLLEESPLPASAVTFEITESAALSQVATASRVMAGLKDLGCRVALDDFGIGSSSLSYLKHFPVDVVKLDGSFISNMLTSEVDYAIVRSINDLAHRIGAKTVAEYVEDEATMAAVSAIGVDYMQGYMFGAPRPLDQLLKGLTPALTA